MLSRCPSSQNKNWKEKSTGNHGVPHEVWGFPAIFPLNQSRTKQNTDEKYGMQGSFLLMVYKCLTVLTHKKLKFADFRDISTLEIRKSCDH